MLKKIYLITIVLLSFFLASYLWNKINLPIQTISEYGSEYLKKSYNKNNDTVRFIIFISISLLPFLFCYLIFYKKKIYTIGELIGLQFNEKINSFMSLNIIFFIFFVGIIVEFFSLDFRIFVSSVDMFHEGIWNSAAYNYFLTGNFWTSSYIDRGLFGSFFPAIFWKVFGDVSIGSSRFLNLIQLLLCKILLLILAKQITLGLNLNFFKKNIFFIFLSSLFIMLVNYYNPAEFYERSLLLLFFLINLLLSFKNNNEFSFYKFSLGLFSAFSMFWFLDIGVYMNLSLIMIFIFYSFRREFKTILSIFFGVLVGWLTFFTILPVNELEAFVLNSKIIFLTLDQIHGLIFPTPLDFNISGGSRATKTLIFFVFGGVFTILLCLNKNHFNNQNKIFFVFLFFISLIAFKSGLSRSDAPHIKTAIGPLMLVINIYLLQYFLFHPLFFSKIEKIPKKLFLTSLVIILFLFNFKFYNFLNIFKAPINIQYLINADDNKFLSFSQNDYVELIQYYKEITPEGQCVQTLTDEVLISYLMKRKTCSKYFLNWLITPPFLQKDLINDLKKSKPTIILLRSELVKFSPKFELVELFIEENYSFHSKFKYWTFVKLNKNK